MKKIITIAILCFSVSAHAGDATQQKQLLVKAKLAGMCGAISQMAKFQESTQMDGGDEFILRFYNTEAARLGKSLEDFLQGCVSVTQQYAEMTKALE